MYKKKVLTIKEAKSSDVLLRKSKINSIFICPDSNGDDARGFFLTLIWFGKFRTYTNSGLHLVVWLMKIAHVLVVLRTFSKAFLENCLQKLRLFEHYRPQKEFSCLRWCDFSRTAPYLLAIRLESKFNINLKMRKKKLKRFLNANSCWPAYTLADSVHRSS